MQCTSGNLLCIQTYLEVMNILKYDLKNMYVHIVKNKYISLKMPNILQSFTFMSYLETWVLAEEMIKLLMIKNAAMGVILAL